MACWILKISDQRLYRDVEGVRYEYDNRHSVRISAGDRVVYLDKRNDGYRFTGAGVVSAVEHRSPTDAERSRGPAVRTVYAALLADVVWFEPPLDIAINGAVGRLNRRILGIPSDVNTKGWGWSISMPSITEERFHAIVNFALTSERASAPPARSVSPQWASPEGLMAVRSPSIAPGARISSPRRSADAAAVGCRAEQVVFDFLAGGAVDGIAHDSLRWPAKNWEYPGWDIEYVDRDGRLHAVEVKGTNALRFLSVEITANEWRAAGAMRELYWLYLVADCSSQRPIIDRIQDPVGRAEANEFSVQPSSWCLVKNLS